ncbi:MAG: hypothetical protein HY323_05620 [Betaproteobacteria bacterium]|nr:hypothetical protein [Betaproteobacteria bacterium]
MIGWSIYDVELEFDDRLVGGIPLVAETAEPEERANAYESWARGQGVEGADASDLAETLAEEGDMPVLTEDAEVAGMTTGFRRDADGLYVEARQVKAMLREAAQRCGLLKQKRGARQVVQHDLHVRAVDGGQKLRLDRMEPDGTDERPISVVTRQGPRTAIKRFEYVNQAQLRFQIRLLSGGVGDGIVGEEELRKMLEFGGWLGLGSDRSQGEGVFRLKEMRRIEE